MNTEISAFNAICITYLSHLNPIIKPKKRSQLNKLIKSFREVFIFNPEHYLATVEHQEIKDFFVERFFNRTLSKDGIVQEFRQVFNPYRKEMVIFTNDSHDTIYGLFDLLSGENTFKILHSPEVCHQILSKIHPQIVSQFITLAYEDDQTKDEMTRKLSLEICKKNGLIGSRNSEIKEKNKLVEEKKMMILALTKENNELVNSLKTIEKNMAKIKAEISDLLESKEAKRVREERLKQAKAKINRLLSMDPDKSIIDSLQTEIEEFKVLVEGIPICQLSLEPLHELKRKGTQLLSTSCGHIFSGPMLGMWLSKKEACPSCRTCTSLSNTFPVYF